MLAASEWRVELIEGTKHGGDPAWPLRIRSGTDSMRFIYPTSNDAPLAATPAMPDEFVLTSLAPGSQTITGFDPMQDVIELSKVQFASFHTGTGGDLGNRRWGNDQPGPRQFGAAAGRQPRALWARTSRRRSSTLAPMSWHSLATISSTWITTRHGTAPPARHTR
jgi:hypothetical protein